MKKSIIVLATLAVALTWLFIPGCAEESNNKSDSPLRVYLMLPFAGLGDRSFADSAYEGLLRAELDMSIYKKAFKAWNTDEAREELFNLIDSPKVGQEMIIAVGYDYTSLLEEANCEYGGRPIVFLDSSVEDCASLKSIVYSTFAPSFLAGVAAMEISQMKAAGAIGGMDIPPVNTFIRGFQAGVEYAGGRYIGTEYVSDEVSGFWSPSTAQTIAETMYLQADVVFPVAGGSNSGAFEAAKAGEGRYSLGVDSDQSYLGKGIIIGSVVKRLDLSVYQAIQEVAQGNFEPGTFNVGLEEQQTEFMVNEVFEELVRQAIENAREAAMQSAEADEAAQAAANDQQATDETEDNE
jgi:basic membrane protein A and related proteins